MVVPEGRKRGGGGKETGKHPAGKKKGCNGGWPSRGGVRLRRKRKFLGVNWAGELTVYRKEVVELSSKGLLSQMRQKNFLGKKTLFARGRSNQKKPGGMEHKTYQTGWEAGKGDPTPFGQGFEMSENGEKYRSSKMKGSWGGGGGLLEQSRKESQEKKPRNLLLLA